MKTLALPLLALLACAPQSLSGPMVRIPGLAEPIPREESHDAQLASLTQQASLKLGCSNVSIERRRGSEIFLATGCKQQALYLRVIETTFLVGLVAEQSLEFLDLGATSSDSLAPKAASRALVWLNIRGATDLACPRQQVVPELHRVGRGTYMPIAEGCGRRATYVPGGESDVLRFAARVDAREAPSGFTPWDGSD